MVPILVLLTFLVFIAAEAVVARRRRAAMVVEGDVLHQAMAEAEPNFVAGFALPKELFYHQGHTWVHRVSDQLAIVGVDDFGRRLLGKGLQISVPPSGAYVHQGDGAIVVRKGGHTIRLRTPVSGEIVGLNPRLAEDPDLIHHDSYGKGWILKIRSTELVNDLTNLLTGSMARRWLEDTRDRFQRQLMLVNGSVIQDGGGLIDDLPSRMDRDQWRALVDEFLGLRRG